MGAYAYFVKILRRRLEEKKVSVRAIALHAGIPTRSVQGILEGHIPSIDRAAQVAAALDLEFYIGYPRPQVPVEIVDILGLPPTAAVAEVVSRIQSRRDSRVEALLEAAAALQEAQQRIHEAAGWKSSQADKYAAKARDILDFMGLHDALAVQPHSSRSRRQPKH